MRVILPTLLGIAALTALSVQAAPNPTKENWLKLDAALSFEFGPDGCGDGSHRSLRRDWRGDWWWGPCIPNWR